MPLTKRAQEAVDRNMEVYRKLWGDIDDDKAPEPIREGEFRCSRCNKITKENRKGQKYCKECGELVHNTKAQKETGTIAIGGQDEQGK